MSHKLTKLKNKNPISSPSPNLPYPAAQQKSDLCVKRTQMDSAQQNPAFGPFPPINPDTNPDELLRHRCSLQQRAEHLVSLFANQHTSKSCSRRPEDSNGNKLFGQQTCLQTQNALCLMPRMFRCFIRVENHEDLRATFIAEMKLQYSFMWCFTDV